jgi:D-amino-acid dehydrogenase
MARVVVVGAGVIGVASAWLLCRAGHEVTLVDRRPGPGQGTSQANGAQLSYAYSDALASPALRAHLPGILFGHDPAYRVRMQADPEFLLWGLRFLLNTGSGRFVGNTTHLLQMAAATRDLLPELLREFELPFDYEPSGKMILHAGANAPAASDTMRDVKRRLGMREVMLSRAEATAIEPALDLYPDEIGRVIYSEDDAAGRPDAFCDALVRGLHERHGLRTLFGLGATAIVEECGRVTGLGFQNREPLPCDWLVLATGSATSLLPRRDRPFGGLWPVQGYSLTAPATARAMRVSITDTRRKIVFARLGDSVRAAGLADIGPREIRFDEARFESFKGASIEAFGAAFEHAPGVELQAWSGGRPCTPSSRPLVRAGSLRGLFLSLGHGTLGWTLCLGSAQRLMQVIAESPVSSS